jgi:hypothetical protein
VIHILKHKLLGIALIVWGLQLLYVATTLALIVFVVLLTGLNKKSSHLLIQILFVIVMIVINIIWRVAIRKRKPEWF